MTGKDGKERFVSEVLDWKRDIEPYKITALWAGVGSGKGGWVERLMQGKVAGSGNPRVMWLTPRAAKRNESAKTVGADYATTWISESGNVYLELGSWGKLQDFEYEPVDLPDNIIKWAKKDPDGTVKIVMPVVGTYYALERALLRTTVKRDPLWANPGFVWNDFDVIVVDECQSLVTDSTYQSAPSAVWSMIKAFAEAKVGPDKHLIVMSGTPEPVETMLTEIDEDIHVIDLRKKTKTVMPKKVRVIHSRDEAEKEMECNALLGDKSLYFILGKITYYKTLMDRFEYEFELDPMMIRTIFTDAEERKRLKESKNLREKELSDWMELHEESVLNTKHLAKEDTNAVIFICTPRWDIGISIEDLDVRYVYVDSHLPVTFIQAMGRLRKASFELVLIDDAYQYDGKIMDDQDGQWVMSCDKAEELNEDYQKMEDENDVEGQHSLIQRWYQGAYGGKYIRFDWYKQRFVADPGLPYYQAYKGDMLAAWNELDKMSVTSYSTYLKQFFSPSVEIERYHSREWKSKEVLQDSKFKEKDAKGMKIYYTQKRIDTLRGKFKDIWNKNYDNVNLYLEKFTDARFAKIYKGPHKGMYRYYTNDNKDTTTEDTNTTTKAVESSKKCKEQTEDDDMKWNDELKYLI